MKNSQKAKLQRLEQKLSTIYSQHDNSLPFHGWHHITFVKEMAARFGPELGANQFIVETAALTHDLNYLIQINSKPEAGSGLREQILYELDYELSQIKQVEMVISEAHLATRGSGNAKDISIEAKALSDADTLFKALPITPILFARDYLEENQIDVHTLARKVVDEQKSLLDKDIYFYSESAKLKYSHWAKTNLILWENVIIALQDGAVQKLIENSPHNNLL